VETYYWGWRDNDGAAHVRRGSGGVGRPLKPGGFDWGYHNAAASALALAILLDVLGDARRARRLQLVFRVRVIQRLDRGARWMLTRRAVLDHVAAIDHEQGLREVS